MDRPTVIIVRHGHTPASAKIQGWSNTELLDAKGRAESRRIAGQLAKFPVVRVVSSDLDRAMETAEAIRRSVHLRHIGTNRALRSWNLGEYQGQESSKAGPAVIRLVHRPYTPAPGGGETFKEFSNRFSGFLNRTLDFVRKRSERGVTVLVTHKRNMALVKMWFEHGRIVPSKIIHKSTDTDPCAGMILTWNGRRWTAEDLE